MTVVGKYSYDRETAALTYLVVVRVVRRSDFYNARALFHVGVLVAYDRDFLVDKRQNNMTAVKVLVALVVLVDCNGGIAEHCFGTCRGDFKHLACFLNFIKNMPEMSLLLLVFDLSVGNRGVAVGAPVDHTVAAVDFAVVVELYKNLLDSLGAALVHCKTLALPVAANA